MNFSDSIQNRFGSVCAALMAALLSSSLQAQTPPAATTTFTENSGTSWLDGANWSSGIPGGSDDAWIGNGQTAFWDQTVSGNPDPSFGTLTLDEGATFQFNGVSTRGLPLNSIVYLSDQSHLQFTSGSVNQDATYNILSGGTATFSPGSNTIPKGTLAGGGNLIVNVSGNTYLRWNTSGHSGNVTYQSNNGSSRYVQITQHGTAPIVGSGVTTFDNNVRVNLQRRDRIHDSATVRFVGAAGGNNHKFATNADQSDTIANLVIDSPVAASSVDYIRTHNSWLRATNSVSFEGTAGTVGIGSTYGPTSSWPGGLDVRGADITFGGTGDWTLNGTNGVLWVDGSTTITTNTNATISNYLRGSGTVQKYGSETLTINGDTSLFTGIINANDGTVAAMGTVNGLSFTSGSELTIGTAASAADSLTIGSGGLSFADGMIINWQYDGAAIAGTDYDTIISGSTLDLTGLTDITIDGTTLGYDAQVGDSFTLFDGTVTGFDAGAFTLNLPTLTTGSWVIQEGSLVLTVVPEPSSFLLGSLGLFGLLLRRRR